MKTLIVCLVAFSILLFSCQSYATMMSGQKLAELAEAADRYDSGSKVPWDIVHTAELMGYLVGVGEAEQGRLVCIARDVKIEQLRTIVQEYLRGHPETWSQRGIELVITALQAYFPCNKD